MRFSRSTSVAVATLVASLVTAGGSAVRAGELIPAYDRSVLPNGLVVLLLEQHEVPVVNFELTLRSGSAADPAGKEGLAELTMALLRKGSERYTAEQVADELDFLGARLDLDASFERCTVSAQFLAKDFDHGLDLLAEILLQPKFDPEEVRKLIALEIDGLRDLKDNPRLVVGDYYDGFLFKGHVFGRRVGGTETSLPAIGRDDILSFYQHNVLPNGAILAVAGDFPMGAMRSKIDKAFGGWAPGEFEPVAVVTPKPAKGRKVLLVDKSDATQTYFRFGNVGIAAGDPDYPTIDVVNTIFGGRFTSWLMNEMRTKAGLTYNAHAAFVRRKVPGAFYVSSFTRTDDTQKAMDLALELLARLHSKGISEEELRSAQNYIRGQFPPDYETPGQLADAMSELEFFGLDRAYINEHTQRTDAVKLADTRKAIATHYPSKDLAIVLVGQAEKVRKVAAKYGTVTEKKVSDPGF
jgi:predicted Zn-dependent peptidase